MKCVDIDYDHLDYRKIEMVGPYNSNYSKFFASACCVDMECLGPKNYCYGFVLQLSYFPLRYLLRLFH